MFPPIYAVYTFSDRIVYSHTQLKDCQIEINRPPPKKKKNNTSSLCLSYPLLSLCFRIIKFLRILHIVLSLKGLSFLTDLSRVNIILFFYRPKNAKQSVPQNDYLRPSKWIWIFGLQPVSTKKLDLFSALFIVSYANKPFIGKFRFQLVMHITAI